jgi:hypothetical protein
MLRTFTTKIKTIVSIRIKNKHNPHIKTLFNVEENYTYSKHTINKINKQKKKDAIHRYWRYHHGDEL